MADITMCQGKNCKTKETCYRYMANANPYRQSYFAEPVAHPNGACDHYWNISKSEMKRLKTLKDNKENYNKFWGITEDKE